MKFYVQTILHDPNNKQYGDCFRTCLACLLSGDGTTPKDVPHFVRDYEDFLAATNEWLGKYYGLYYQSLTVPLDKLAGYCIITGPTTRFPSGDVLHCVVGHADEVIWDPNPSKAGLDETKRDEFIYGYLLSVRI